MPARQIPTANRKARPEPKPVQLPEKPALMTAPAMQAMAKMRLVEYLSAQPDQASQSVPAMKPDWVAAISQANWAEPICQAAIRSLAALFGLNHSDVPSHSASTIRPTAHFPGFMYAGSCTRVHARALMKRGFMKRGSVPKPGRRSGHRHFPGQPTPAADPEASCCPGLRWMRGAQSGFQHRPGW